MPSKTSPGTVRWTPEARDAIASAKAVLGGTVNHIVNECVCLAAPMLKAQHIAKVQAIAAKDAEAATKIPIARVDPAAGAAANLVKKRKPGANPEP